jgi:Prokaryotic homologs of the JAB domain
LLGGWTPDRVELFEALPNLAGLGSFRADPYSQYKAEQRLRRAGCTIVAVYHSHPNGCGRLSTADEVLAVRSGALQVVAGLRCTCPDGRMIRGFRHDPSLGRILEIPVAGMGPGFR